MIFEIKDRSNLKTFFCQQIMSFTVATPGTKIPSREMPCRIFALFNTKQVKQTEYQSQIKLLTKT